MFTRGVALRRLLIALFATTLILASCGDDAGQSGAGSDPEAGDDADATDDDTDEDGMDGEHDHEHDGDDDHDGDHDHDHDHSEVIEVPDGMAVPSVAVSAEVDGPGAVNLFVDLDDFTVNPEAVSTDAVDGEGHLHLYIDGERERRFYNTAILVDGLSAGTHELMVEVSANNHSAYAVDGEPIRATVEVEVEEAEGHDHGHGAELFESASPPTVDLEVTKDPKSGWNVHAIMSDDFTFAPESINGEAVDGEGHLHLYVDGQKVGRLYGPWTHLSGLTPGTHVIEVEVSANDHRAYGVDGEPLRAQASIEASGDAAPADVVIVGSWTDGEIQFDELRYEVEQGSTVEIRFTSDQAEEIHVHGYDYLAEVGPGQIGVIVFEADSRGTFEVELERSGQLLFDLVVS